MRILFTLLAVKLLEIDGLLFIGGVLLIYIAIKLLVTEENTDIRVSKKSFWGAVWTIMLADFLMGIDNIIAVAGADLWKYAISHLWSPYLYSHNCLGKYNCHSHYR